MSQATRIRRACHHRSPPPRNLARLSDACNRTWPYIYGMSESAPFSAESYFATQPPPASLEHDILGVRGFVQQQLKKDRNVVLVTEFTFVVTICPPPPDARVVGRLSRWSLMCEVTPGIVVRFLDNFSAGMIYLCATSAEYFLKAGYAVIFMHRQFSLQPFSRHYSHSTNPFLDFLEIETPPVASPDSTPQICVAKEKREDLMSVLTAYKSVQASGTLHTLAFVTVNDYLWLLRAGLYYLAAAVSDFFLPRQKMSEHKIQSGKGSLHIEMDQVPKILKSMVDEWTKDGFIVSFKARAALKRYGHQLVIGNELHTRKYQVLFVTPSSHTSIPDDLVDEDSAFTETWLRVDIPSTPSAVSQKEIEEDIVWN
ncbi:phosphopantothenate-cysteine ligase [Salix suchowensis]|nr:phosphopantothenate-cysteine ligase [Salix suchowensis]